MTRAEFWKQMADRFESLQKEVAATGEKISAIEVDGRWEVVGGTDEQRAKFAELSAIAGRAVSGLFPPGVQ